MSGIRFRLDLFIPEDIYNSLPSAMKISYRDRIRNLKALAIKINGEDTTKAVWHKCFHDESPIRPCEPDQEI